MIPLKMHVWFWGVLIVSDVFYTSVDIWGDNVLIREIRDGVRTSRKEKFKPTIYIKDFGVPPTEFTSLYGDLVRAIQPGSIKECKDYFKKMEGTQNFEIFGQLNYGLQYMGQYPMGSWLFSHLNVQSIDIECMKPPGGGFAKPEFALGEINLITMQNYHTKQCITFGTLESGDIKTTQYVKCVDEKSLLKMFLQHWEQNMPDIITGWNSNGFDLPYLINRITKILGMAYTKKLSPWGEVSCEVREYMGKLELKIRILGVQCMDLMLLMKKFTYGGRESWALGSVAQDEIGETKRENPADTFEEFYLKFPEMFVDYNVQDTRLVTKINEKNQLLELAVTIAYMARVNYEDVYSPVKLWDNIIHNMLLEEKIVIPQRQHSDSGKEIVGAYVKVPVPGMYKDIGSIDATSLYPSLMMTLNLSPETYMGMTASSIEACLEGIYANDDPDVAMGANGALFRTTTIGIIPRLIAKYMAARKTAKKEMLKLEQELENIKKSGEATDTSELKGRIASLNNLQMAIKILMNSLYGAMANKGFRFFNPDVAESITSTGQLYLRAIEKNIDKILCELFKIPMQKIMVYADTDSVYFTLEKIIEKYAPNASIEQRINLIEKLTSEKLVPAVNKITEKVSSDIHAFEHKIIFKNEIAADKAIWLGKKMYICHAYSSEGVRYAKPKYKTMGVAMVRSSTPKAVQKFLRDSLDVIFEGGEAQTQKHILSIFDQFNKFSAEDIAFPRGVSDVTKYTSNSTIYAKGTPIAVRAALLHNFHIEKFGLTDKYEPIKDGDKIRFIYLKLPNPIRENIIGWSADSKLPPEFDLHKYIDWDTQFNKTFKDAIENIIEPIGWSCEQRSNLSSLFD
jgi:DNA polymerase elongation subunit (family B)